MASPRMTGGSARLNPKHFHQCFLSWPKPSSTHGGGLAMARPSRRLTGPPNCPPCCGISPVLAKRRTRHGFQDTQPTPGTLEAPGHQPGIVRSTPWDAREPSQQGDYLTLKGNHKSTYRAGYFMTTEPSSLRDEDSSMPSTPPTGGLFDDASGYYATLRHC